MHSNPTVQPQALLAAYTHCSVYGRRLRMADAPEQRLVIRCRNCHHSITVDLSRLRATEERGKCPKCGYRNVFGVDSPRKDPLYPSR
jgi:predicted Zn finger-like uncharacterized protein